MLCVFPLKAAAHFGVPVLNWRWRLHQHRIVSRALAACSCWVPAIVTAQTSTASASVGIAGDIDTYVKVIGGILAGLGTLFGLPLVFLTYKKTRAEIRKLELEAAGIQEKLINSDARIPAPDEGGTRISIENSKDITVQVLADPRFLGPLLLLLDFILAWIILTLAGYVFRTFDLGGILSGPALAFLALSLLIPIAKEALRVRSVLRPPRSSNEVAAALRQAKLVAYFFFIVPTLSVIAIGLFAYSDSGKGTNERFIAYGALAIGALLIVSAPFLKPRLDRYLAKVID